MEHKFDDQREHDDGDLENAHREIRPSQEYDEDHEVVNAEEGGVLLSHRRERVGHDDADQVLTGALELLGSLSSSAPCLGSSAPCLEAVMN